MKLDFKQYLAVRNWLKEEFDFDVEKYTKVNDTQENWNIHVWDYFPMGEKERALWCFWVQYHKYDFHRVKENFYVWDFKEECLRYFLNSDWVHIDMFDDFVEFMGKHDRHIRSFGDFVVTHKTNLIHGSLEGPHYNLKSAFKKTVIDFDEVDLFDYEPAGTEDLAYEWFARGAKYQKMMGEKLCNR